MIYILFAKGKKMDNDMKADMFTILFRAKSIYLQRGNIQFHGNVLMQYEYCLVHTIVEETFIAFEM